ncbi:GGDEF domain-containing response regulator [Clostridium vincentii]|uniref:Stage 0 sporulation protein A homolog n=1 Tax=Clostridium vincentii TaxID=52704 RepID=A0A2T0BIN3_9CLOT|nr:diguanylate cyclase [Clostridium vincentii]PRR83717.1 Phytochrome-like protein cph2 [Clostridium vincentii]
MKYKIAIIDDNPEEIVRIRKMLIKANSKHEYLIFEFTNPGEALKELAKNIMDCIFLDYNCPEIKGLEFIQKFINVKNIDTPIILLIGHGNEKIAVKSFENEAFDYIIKSEISGELLEKTIIRGIEKRDFERKEKTYNEFIKTIIDLMPVPLFYKDKKRIFLGCNRAFEDIVGKSKEEIIGKTTKDIFEKEKNKKFTYMDKQLFDNPGTQMYEYEYEGSNDEKKYVILNKTTYKNSLGEVDGIIGIISDITDVKKRELELAGKTFLDSLTGILNRRYFDENVENEWKKCVREQKSITFIMIDIDLFKSYNDYYGHPEGDNCLKKIAQEIKVSLLRPSDIVIRYGGEEFVAILPDTNIEGALSVAQRIKENILRLAIKNEASTINDFVTVSQGIAEINNKNNSVHKCLINADKALYMAKENGRNEIKICD